MPRLRLLSLLAAAPLLHAQGMHYAPSSNATVTLATGKLQGAEPAPGIHAFLGIPYAAPPVGALRWRPPQPFGPLSSADSPRLAVAHGAPCAQQRFGWNDGWVDHAGEDCLFLNVWAPAQAHKLPVMVYIHGGSNTAGSASEVLSNGLTLVPKGVLLVTFDYRLGIFGFFRTPALDHESGYDGSGNYGLLDQIAALRWVHDNIAAFGGDPGNVTLFGESAGAVDTGLLMTSPLARGLFQRALEESGQVLGLMPTASREQAEQAWAPVAASLGPDLAAMRQASVAAVLAAEKAAPKPPAENFWGYRGASVDGYVLPELPARVFAEGHEAPVPLLLGTNIQEIVPHDQPPAETRRLIEAVFGPAQAATLEALYANPPGNSPVGDAGAQFQTDRDFHCPVLQVATWHASHGFPTFVYQFDRTPGSSEPAHHASELRFVFGFPAGDSLTPPPSQDDRTAAQLVAAYWTTFARTGSPAGSGWPRFAPATGDFLHFLSGNPAASAQTHFGGQPCTILNATNLPGSR